jgi:tRNA(fMet)-specific endonuclease VapC
MGLLIDSNVLIAIEREDRGISTLFDAVGDEDAAISVVTASELLHGVHRATAAGIRSKRQAFVEGVLSALPVLEIDLTTARSHARLWSDLLKRGQMIGIHDSWLAATCLVHDLTLLTANVREFRRVAGLRLEVWP